MARKYDWKKCPSVREGGWPFFWTAETPAGRRWILRNRHTEQWEVRCESYWNPETAQYEAKRHPVESVLAGKKWVEENEGIML